MILFDKRSWSESGNMLIELLLTIALAMLIIPFVFKYSQNSVTRAENIAVVRQMESVQHALERYIVAHRQDLLTTVGRSITRVRLDELQEFGLPDTIIESGKDKYQLRILKSKDVNDSASLQGVVVFTDNSISPMRTREIVNTAGDTFGFVDGKDAYGAFGTWHTDTVSLGVSASDGIIGTTAINRDNALYLWRVPSDNLEDAKMLSPLNLAGHDIVNASFFDAKNAMFQEKISVQEFVATDVVFSNRITLEKAYNSQSGVVSGVLSSDGRSMNVSGELTLADLGKFSNFMVDNLWVFNLTLSGLSIIDDDSVATLKINQALDMTAGRIDAMFVTVGFAGSITPRLSITTRIEDSSNSNYYWDVESKNANFSDVTLVELNRLATMATYRNSDASTISTQLFGSVAANQNATVADYTNALEEIQKKVRVKYQQLNLQ